MRIFFKCNEAVHVCDKSQYNEASFIEKLKLQLHILRCKICRKHVTQNHKLTKAVKTANIKTLNSEEKQKIKNRLQQEKVDI